MLKKFWILIVVLLLVAACFLVWRLQQNTLYQLEVINRAEQSVDHVRLFGTALAKEMKIEQLAAGGSSTLVAILRPDGDLKFEVLIAGTKIDTFIQQDIRELKTEQQRLEIHPNNRFIISNAPAQ
jgi:hypothetical protein